MPWLEQLISSYLGEWSLWVMPMIALIVWMINKAATWFATSRTAPRGAPSSERHWRDRLAEALAQYGLAPDAERRQFSDRVAQARIMVEAHEARKRVGIGGARGLWFLSGTFAVFAAGTASLAEAVNRPGLWLLTVLFTALMISYELIALMVSNASKERLGVLAEAGRRGHSDLVREDPWLVLRTYDHWRKEHDLRKFWWARRSREARRISGVTRRQRSLTGQSIWRPCSSLTYDIWALKAEAPKGTTDQNLGES